MRLIIKKYTDSFNDYEYEKKESVVTAKEIIQEYLEISRKDSFEFDDSKWKLYIDLNNTYCHIDFDKYANKINAHVKFLDSNKIIILKCWIATLIERYHPSTVKGNLNALVRFFNISNGLKRLEYNDIYSVFIKMTTTMQMSLCIALNNLIDYKDDFFGVKTLEISNLILNLKKLIKRERNVRILPSTHDILLFDQVIRHYFNKELGENDFIKWFPIYFWWSITTLIPMRISEFCKLQKNSFFEKNGKCYIKIKRIKHNKKTEIQIITEMVIPEKLYQQVRNYSKKTKKMDPANTLFSRRLIRKKLKISRDVKSPDFNARFFNKILKSFYDEIVFCKYNIENKLEDNGDHLEYKSLSISRKILPNDTRHLAFINLKRQGYHPVEVARIGGHTTLRSQEHYFAHLGNFMDLELLSLFTNIELDSEVSINKSFIDRYILRPYNKNFKLKMEDGFCTDQLMRCPVNDCWDCDYWRITEEEFLLKKEKLLIKMNNKKDEVKLLIQTMNKIFNDISAGVGKYTNTYEYSNDLKEEQRLRVLSNEIETAIFKYIDLKKIENGDKVIGR